VYRTRPVADARIALFMFIEGWYNPRRRDSALAYASPIDFEQAQSQALERSKLAGLPNGGAAARSAAPPVDKPRQEEPQTG